MLRLKKLVIREFRGLTRSGRQLERKTRVSGLNSAAPPVACFVFVFCFHQVMLCTSLPGRETPRRNFRQPAPGGMGAGFLLM